MNAPTRADHLLQPNIELLPLAAIALSETEIQRQRRSTYKPEALEELAQSIRDGGLLFPIVVRPLAALRGLAKYELVAGERRWIAAGKADQLHIAARIMELTDGQVLKAQLVENLQREGLDTLAEAAGYKELLALGVHADAIAAMIGKSKSYVYARTKLLELTAPVQAALKEGEIDASQALAFARVPAKLQEKALKEVQRYGVETFRETADTIRNKCFLELRAVPFSLTDDSYFMFGPKRGSGRHAMQDMITLPACTGCPKRSGNDAELLDALEGNADICTDGECHDAKVKAEYARRRERAVAAGREILTGEAAAAITPGAHGPRGGYQDLDDVCHQDRYPGEEPEGDDYESAEWQAYERQCEAWRERSYREILGEDLAQLTEQLKLIENPRNKGRLHELAPIKPLLRLLKAKGLKVKIHEDQSKEPIAPAPATPRDAEKAARAAEKQAAAQAAAELDENIEHETRLRMVRTMHAKWKGPLSRDDLELVVEFFLEESGWPDSMELLYPKRVTPATLSERDLGRLLVSWAVCAYADGYRQNDRPLKALCKRLKIDEKAITKEVRAALAPKDAAAPAKKRGKAKGKKK